MVLVGNTFFFKWEVSLIVWIQSFLDGAGTTLMSVFSMLGEEIVYASVLILGFLFWCRDKEFGKAVGLNVLIALVLNPMIKNIFMRRRPYFDHPEIKCLKPVDPNADIYDIKAQGFSFPSGHSMNSATLFGSLRAYRKSRLLTAAAIVLPLLCGVSRFCLGVHYPSDVFVGWLLGIAIVLLIPVLCEKIKDRRILYAVIIAMTAPGLFFCKSSDYFTSFGMLIGFIVGTEFEDRFVKFENTKNPLRCVLRLIGGIAVFFTASVLLKLPFSPGFLDSGTLSAYIVRALRYCISLFLCIGVYPMIFKPFDKIFRGKNTANEK